MRRFGRDIGFLFFCSFLILSISGCDPDYNNPIEDESSIDPINGGIVINDGDEYASALDATVKVTAPAGATAMAIIEGTDFNDSAWEPVASTKAWHFFGDAEHTLNAKFRLDGANMTTVVSDSIIVDTRGAVGTVVINGGLDATPTSQVVLTLDATDTTSGVAEVKISNDATLADASWQTFVSSVSWQLSAGDGEKVVYAAFRDKAGNVSETVQDAIQLDTALPTGATVAIAADYTSNLNVQVVVYSPDPRAQAVEVSEDSNVTSAAAVAYSAGTFESLVFGLSAGDGTKQVYARFFDDNGQPVGETPSDFIMVDCTVPTTPTFTTALAWPDCQRESSLSTWYTRCGQHAYKLFGSSVDTNLKGYQVCHRGPTDSSCTWTDVQNPASVSFAGVANGTYITEFRAVDHAGNLSPVAHYEDLEDTVVPVLPTVTAAWTDMTGYWCLWIDVVFSDTDLRMVELQANDVMANLDTCTWEGPASSDHGSCPWSGGYNPSFVMLRDQLTNNTAVFHGTGVYCDYLTFTPSSIYYRAKLTDYADNSRVSGIQTWDYP